MYNFINSIFTDRILKGIYHAVIYLSQNLQYDGVNFWQIYKPYSGFVELKMNLNNFSENEDNALGLIFGLWLREWIHL